MCGPPRRRSVNRDGGLQVRSHRDGGLQVRSLALQLATCAAARACNTTAAWTLSFAYSGAYQNATLPHDFAASCGAAETSVAVDARLWGAGGAASCTPVNWPPSSPAAYGGGGGFVRASAFLPRAANDDAAAAEVVLRVIVGRGGLNARVATGADAMGAGGGANTKTGKANVNPGGGGGRSALHVSYDGGASFSEVATAGGGGGAYLYGNAGDGFYYAYGGGGGFPEGESGAVSATPLTQNPPLGSRAFATFGSWASGGTNASAGFCRGPTTDGGGFLVGGVCSPSASPNFGTGGGGGYYGGGAAPEKGKSAGGGGSGFVDTEDFNFSLVSFENAVLNSPGGVRDPFYAGGSLAIGAVSTCTSPNTAAGNGGVVLLLACGCTLRPSSSPSPSVTASASASPSASPSCSFTSTPSLSPTSSVGAAAVAAAAAAQAQALQSLIVTSSLSSVFGAACLLACGAVVLRRRRLAAKEEHLRRTKVVAEIARSTRSGPAPVIYQVNLIGSRAPAASAGPGDVSVPPPPEAGAGGASSDGGATAAAAGGAPFVLLGRSRQQSALRSGMDWSGRAR